MSISIFLIIFLALFVRLPFLSGSFWMDEAAQALESMRPFQDQLKIAADFQPPLFHYWVHFFTRVSMQEWWLRIASLLPSLGTIALLLCWPNKKHQQHGTYAAILLSLSAFHVFFSQELRQYTMAAWWGTLSWWVVMRWVEDKKNKRLLWMRALTLGVIHTAGFYTMYVYPFLWIAQGCYVLFHERRLFKIFLGSVVVTGLLFLPWIPGFLEQLRIGTTLQHSLPGWAQVVSAPQWKALPLVFFKFLGGGKEINLSVFDAFYFGLPTLALAVLVWKYIKRIPTYLWYWAVLPIVLAWGVSFVVPVVSPKRVLFALPAFFLVITHLVYEVKDVYIKHKLTLFFVALQAMGLVFLWTTPSMQREEWRGMIETFHQKYSTSDTVVVFGFTAPFAPWPYYEMRYPLQFHTIAFPVMPLTSKDINKQLEGIETYKRVLILDYLRDLTDLNRLIESYLEEHGFVGIASLETKNMGFVRVYEQKSYVSFKHFAPAPQFKVQ